MKNVKNFAKLWEMTQCQKLGKQLSFNLMVKPLQGVMDLVGQMLDGVEHVI